MNVYDVGDLVELDGGPFLDDDGIPTDPNTVVVQIRRLMRRGDTSVPGTETLPTEHDGTGLYHATYSPTTWGLYAYRFAGTGAVQAAEEDLFMVRWSYFEGTS